MNSANRYKPGFSLERRNGNGSGSSLEGMGRSGLGQTFDEILGFGPAMGDAIRLFFHSTSSFLAFKVALGREKGFIQYLGWFLGIGQGVGAVCDMISLGKRALGMHPSEHPIPLCNVLTPPPPLPMAPPVPTMPVDNLPGSR